MGNQDGRVSVEARLWPRQSEFRIPVGAKDFFLLQIGLDELQDTPSPSFNGYECSFPGDKVTTA
jgi:hypothetical protein